MAREMKDSGIAWIGEIPKEWEVLPHKYIMHKKKEIQEHYNGEDIISLTMNGVVVRDLSAGGKIPLTFDGYQKVYKGNLLQCLFDIDVTPRCVGLIKNDGVTSPAYSQFEVHQGSFAPYYDYLLRYMDDNKVLLHLSKNLRSSLTETDFGTIPTILPTLSEQQAIANFLDEKCGEIDELVALQEKMIDELKAYKQSVITETVTKGLQPNVKMKDIGVEWIGEIPEHWSIQRLRTLGWTQNGISKGGEYFGEDFEFPFVSYPDAYKNFVVPYPTGRANSSESDRETYSLEEGDVLFTRTSETIEEIGFASTCINTIPNAIYSGFLIRFRPTTDALYKGFSKYYFRGQMLRGYFVKQMNIVTRASLSQDLLKSLIVILPPLSEQHSIATYLDEKCSEIDSLISIKQKKIEELKDYKKSLIYEYVTGKKQVG